MHLASRRHPSSRSGFTLIELLITVAIIAILAAVAYPSFMDALRKSRRTDAVSALTRIQHAQERWRANNATYSGALDAAGLNVTATSPDGHYDMAITNSAAATYTATATAKAASPQHLDTKCMALQIRLVSNLGASGILEYGSLDAGTNTLTTTANNPCWIK